MNGCFDSDDDAGLDTILQQQQQRLKSQVAFVINSSNNNNNTSSSSTSHTPADSSVDSYNFTETTFVPETPELIPTFKKRTVKEPAADSSTLHSKRVRLCPLSPMGNGFRHERVANTNGTSDNKSSESTNNSCDMPWQNKHAEKAPQTHHPSVSSSSSQPSSSSHDSTSRPPRYQQRIVRSHLMSSDSDDNNDWRERTLESAASHPSNLDQSHAQQRSKRAGAAVQRKSRPGYLSRNNRESANNNSSNGQPSSSQYNSDPGANTATSRYNHKIKRNTATTNNNSSGQSSGPSNEDSAQSSIQTTPKNRHLHRLRMSHNRQAVGSALSFTNNLAVSETNFPSNVPFRRDDPGRRAFQRTGHPLHGRRSQGSGGHHHRSPLLRVHDASFSSIVARNPDLFDSESTDESNELFANSSCSPGRNRRFPSTPSPRQQQQQPRDNYQFQPYSSMVLPENDGENSEESEEPSVVFVSQNSLSPSARTLRGDQGRFTGGRRRRSSRSSHLVSSGEPIDILSGSPDPVAQVNQMEEDELFARLLQAEFDAEVPHNLHQGRGHGAGRHSQSESDGDVLVDEEDILSSPSSSSSNAEESAAVTGRLGSQYYLRYRGNLTDSLTLDLTGATGGGGNRAPARGRRRNSRAANTNPPVAPPVAPPRHHWLGSPVRGRRGRTRNNSDPLMLQFGRWLGWAILRNIDTDEGDDYEVLWNLAESMGEAVPRGLQRHEISRLPTHKYQAGTTSDSTLGAGSSTTTNNNIPESSGATFTEATKECRVCLCDYENNELLRVLPCFHEFHAVCIDRWLKNNNTCPVCRAEIALDA